VRQVVVEDLKRMLAAMEEAGLQPVISSAYRSYAEQEATYAYWVHTLGQREADRVSARPGHSEHQLGTAIDFASAENGYELDESFANTREGRWLLANASRYGFVLSYPAGKEAVTGYAYEPWHYRYVGVAAAQEIARSGLTPLEYYRSRAR
jgi:D-alanyl-D-alanine carboxypeptidase